MATVHAYFAFMSANSSLDHAQQRSPVPDVLDLIIHVLHGICSHISSGDCVPINIGTLDIILMSG